MIQAVKEKHDERVAVLLRKSCEYILCTILDIRYNKKMTLGELLHPYIKSHKKDYMLINSIQIIREASNQIVHAYDKDCATTKPLRLSWAVDNFIGLIEYLY